MFYGSNIIANNVCHIINGVQLNAEKCYRVPAFGYWIAATNIVPYINFDAPQIPDNFHTGRFVIAEMIITLVGTIFAVVIMYAHNMTKLRYNVPKWLLAFIKLSQPYDEGDEKCKAKV